ncbi:MAG TPA: hypothetical protein VHM90_05755 [Phycisphaerae bacterium]|jgi:hypothetical protein|nr:hypothetical protein [Phycisphaerae bacterium]
MHESETSLGLHPEQKTSLYAPGTVVQITQQIPRRIDTYTTTVTGTVVRQERQNSGSWYARNKRNKVWLDRLVIRKQDGEITILNLDEYTVVEVLEGGAPARGESPLVEPNQDASASVT